ncbi:MAG: hypothetical protein JSV62_05460 [Promethearchaeota archaeon]|nr:MAG: hypothetical protein JSV62_05460 [Candidatus Lokiarchaeota archaeon]
MKNIRIAGLIILIVGFMISLLSLWGAGTINWNWNSLNMLNMLFWLIIGIILLIIGLVCLVVATLRKKSRKRRECPYCNIFLEYLEKESIYQCPECKRKFR